MSFIITGNCFVRDLQSTHHDKKLYLIMGQLWVPASIELGSEHLYKLVGSQYSDAGEWPTIGLQVLLNSGKDVSKDSRKKDPTKLFSLTHTEHP